LVEAIKVVTGHTAPSRVGVAHDKDSFLVTIRESFLKGTFTRRLTIVVHNRELFPIQGKIIWVIDWVLSKEPLTNMCIFLK
jgi:hypothetical protein